MIIKKQYASGLRLIVKKIDGLMSVTMGILVGVGSAWEDEQTSGISHFIEHVNFKGTKKRTSFDISENADAIGAQLNAFTTKDMTCYHIKSTTEHAEEAFEILSDLFINSTYEKTELDKERTVIVEEINMDEDSPEDLVFDMLGEAYFGKTGYGRTILGKTENVERFSKEDIGKYKALHYTADNIVVSIAGNIDIEKAEEFVEKYMEGKLPVSDKKRILALEKPILSDVCKRKDIEQVHFCLAFNGIRYSDPDVDPVNIINVALGGGMSSRLFQKVREELGLCYTVYSYPNAYVNTGTFVVYSAVNPKKYKLAYDTVLNVIDEFKLNGITEAEFKRSKEQIKSSFTFSQDSTASQMNIYGKYLLFENKIFDFESKINAINALSLDEVNEKIKEYFDFNSFATAVLGKNVEKLK